MLDNQAMLVNIFGLVVPIMEVSLNTILIGLLVPGNRVVVIYGRKSSQMISSGIELHSLEPCNSDQCLPPEWVIVKELQHTCKLHRPSMPPLLLTGMDNTYLNHRIDKKIVQ